MNANFPRSGWVGLLVAAMGFAFGAEPVSSESATACHVAETTAAAATPPDHDENWCRKKIENVIYFSTKSGARVYANRLQQTQGFVAQDGKQVYVGTEALVPVIDPADSALLVDPDSELYYQHETSNYAAFTNWLDAFANARLHAMIGFKGGEYAIPSTRRPRVAVLDTGVSPHDEFKRSPNDVAFVSWYGTEASADGNRCMPVAERVGRRHGTQVAGLIAANANDGIGIAGIGEVEELLSIDVPELVGGCFSRRRLVAALDCAVDQRADIINISMQSSEGLPRPDDLYVAMEQKKKVVGTARLDTRRALVVVAAGNRGCDLGDP
ncbi:MAG TPA: S8 family serine peptidase, partial [Tahibacter sp.]|nr:S8 family serine peptidase [Tahibacter sp.]